MIVNSRYNLNHKKWRTFSLHTFTGITSRRSTWLSRIH